MRGTYCLGDSSLGMHQPGSPTFYDDATEEAWSCATTLRRRPWDEQFGDHLGHARPWAWPGRR
eukprot:7863469-Alexandrium_andersonii.AAC.1